MDVIGCVDAPALFSGGESADAWLGNIVDADPVNTDAAGNDVCAPCLTST